MEKLKFCKKRCIRNVALKSYKAHTEPLFKDLEILKFSDKLSYCRSVFMHQYRNNKLPITFSNIFTEISETDDFQTRHNHYNYICKPSCKKYLENFPYKKLLLNWNALNLDLKSTSDFDEFQQLLKETYLSNYNHSMQCNSSCFSCSNHN